MDASKEYWYEGEYEKYRDLPWLHQLNSPPIMPWKVVDPVPYGYIVFVSSGGTKFKMFSNPALVSGDVVV